MRKCKIPQGSVMLTSYERTAEKLLKGIPKTNIFGTFYEGAFCVGTKSLHNTKQARIWRLFWRLKFKRLNHLKD